MTSVRNPYRGFTLLEVAIVLLITGALMGAMLQPYGAHLVERKRNDTRVQLMHIRDALLGFAAANHRLPCPVQNGSDLVGDCSSPHGYVPSALLGIDGTFDSRGLLLDTWGMPIRYSVTESDSDSDGNPDFTFAFGMQMAGMQTLTPDLEVCATANPCAELRANQVPVVIYSTGPAANARSADENENLDSDTRFVIREPDMAGSDRFDDLLIWVSENSLYTHLIRAGALP